MFLHTINPIAFEIGVIQIRYYSLMYIFGILIGYLFLEYFRKTDPKFPLNKGEIIDLIFWIFVGVIIGARLGIALFYNPSFYFTHPLEILAVWKGGMSFHGAFIGAIISFIIYCGNRKIHPLFLGDYVIIPVALALAFGRIGNFLNGELWGRITDLSFCVDYSQNSNITNPPEGCRHPSQIYEFLKNILNFAILLWMYFKMQYRKPGTIFFTFIIIYGALRFLVEYVRVPSWIYANLTAGQWLSIPLIITGLVGLFILYGKKSNY